MGTSAPPIFPLSFCFSLADQLLDQTRKYRDEGSVHELQTILHRYRRIIEVITEHPSYSSKAMQEELNHNHVYCELVGELQTLKLILRHDLPQLGSLPFQILGNVGEEEPRTNCTAVSHSSVQPMVESPEAVTRSGHVNVHAVTVSFPSPSVSYVEDAPLDTHLSYVKPAESEGGNSSSINELGPAISLAKVHISPQLMEDFLELARDNTKEDLETCGTLCAFLDKGTFYVTTLIIPKQESTANSCQAKNEEEVFAIQHERALFPVGWIHTHPSQSCFMSSTDLHTQYSYQVMVPEAFAIVMAPTDTSRSYGIFRLSDPGGMDVLRECQEKGSFHPHEETTDGSPLYHQCSNVCINSHLRFEIFDLR